MILLGLFAPRLPGAAFEAALDHIRYLVYADAQVRFGRGFLRRFLCRGLLRRFRFGGLNGRQFLFR